jgi:hypothetical protein
MMARTGCLTLLGARATVMAGILRQVRMGLARLWLVGVLVVPLALAGCGGDEPPPASFAPLHYEYLRPLRLNVGSIDVQDHSAPAGDGDVASQAPVPPAQALVQMAHDRLFAAGLSGQAIFVIDQASIVRGPDDTLNGQLAVHIEVLTAGGARAGYAEARVARQHVPGSDDEDLRTVLYGMTKQMMDDMNVELEYQIRHTMSDWLVANTIVPAPVTVAPLQAPAPPPSPDTSIPGVDLSPAPGPPPEAAPDQAPPPQQMSPPPGFLQLPPGTPP